MSRSPSPALHVQLRAARTAAGLTQAALADALGSAGGQASIARWEAGERTPDAPTLGRLAAALGAPLVLVEEVEGARIRIEATPIR